MVVGARIHTNIMYHHGFVPCSAKLSEWMMAGKTGGARIDNRDRI